MSRLSYAEDGPFDDRDEEDCEQPETYVLVDDDREDFYSDIGHSESQYDFA